MCRTGWAQKLSLKSSGRVAKIILEDVKVSLQSFTSGGDTKKSIKNLSISSLRNQRRRTDAAPHMVLPCG